MTVNVNHSVTTNLPYSSTLADLEELVTAAKSAGFSSAAKLRVQHYAGGQWDPSYTTITVTTR